MYMLCSIVAVLFAALLPPKYEYHENHNPQTQPQPTTTGTRTLPPHYRLFLQLLQVHTTPALLTQCHKPLYTRETLPYSEIGRLPPFLLFRLFYAFALLEIDPF